MTIYCKCLNNEIKFINIVLICFNIRLYYTLVYNSVYILQEVLSALIFLHTVVVIDHLENVSSRSCTSTEIRTTSTCTSRQQR